MVVGEVVVVFDIKIVRPVVGVVVVVLFVMYLVCFEADVSAMANIEQSRDGYIGVHTTLATVIPRQLHTSDTFAAGIWDSHFVDRSGHAGTAAPRRSIPGGL